MRRTLTIALAVLLAACASSPRRPATPLATREWPDVIASATMSAASGDYDAADRTLDNYAQRYPGTTEARETSYWRALFELDPANRAGSTHAAQQRLAEYLAAPADAPHREEAQVLRRIASAIDSTHAAYRTSLANADALRAAQSDQAVQRQQELQKEIQRLKEQLDKTTAELDRIKKRLAGKGP